MKQLSFSEQLNPSPDETKSSSTNRIQLENLLDDVFVIHWVWRMILKPKGMEGR